MVRFARRAGQPLAEPLTLAEALAHLRVSAGVEDAYITSLIPVVREACENRIERTLISTAWRLVLDGFPASGVVELGMGPVIAVTSIEYLDQDGAEQTLATSAWDLDTFAEPARLYRAPGAQWPQTQATYNAVTINYTAGYGATDEAVPASLKHWLLLALADLYENRAAHGEKPAVPHNFVDGLLDPYRMLGI